MHHRVLSQWVPGDTIHGSAGPPLLLPLQPSVFNQLSLVSHPRHYRTPTRLTARDSYVEEQRALEQVIVIVT